MVHFEFLKKCLLCNDIGVMETISPYVKIFMLYDCTNIV